MHVGQWGIAPPILNLCKHLGGSGQFHDLATFFLEETASDTHGIGDWVKPGAGLDTLV